MEQNEYKTMKITNIKQLAHYIAICNQQEKCNKDHIIIRKYRDFSEKDKEEINTIKQELKAIFDNYAYLQMTYEEYQNYLLDKIKKIAQYYFLGFVVQDKIIELCKISIKDGN